MLPRSGTSVEKRPNFIVPVPLSAQYHAAPYGSLGPYVGLVLMAYMHTRSKAIKVDSGFGPVLQAGVEFYF